MSGIFENPFPLIVIGVITAIISGGMWLQTGRKSALYATLVLVVLMIGLVIVAQLVESERERVSRTLHQIAREVEQNDVEAVLSHVHPNAPQVRAQAAAELPTYTFQSVDIKRNLEITIFSERTPPQAVARFNAVAVLSDRSGLINNRHVPRFVVVTFEQDNDEWKVVDYEHLDPQVGYQRKDR